MQQEHNPWLDDEPVIISVREVDYDPLEATQLQNNTALTMLLPRKRRLALAIMSLLFALLTVAVGVYGIYRALPEQVVYVIVQSESASSEENPDSDIVGLADTSTDANESVLAPFFTDEVLFWEAHIVRWADQYDLDPNLIATVMQIESCGDPLVGSSAGAQGLFQVMPFHFAEGENPQDPETNALRGMNYLATGLDLADGDVGLALAGYNGGHGVINIGYSRWYNETQRYYYWGLGIYEDAVAGLEESDRLNEWLANNGQWLCNNAAVTQQNLQ